MVVEFDVTFKKEKFMKFHEFEGGPRIEIS